MDLPTWVDLPDLDINSKIESNSESEVDELAHDDNAHSLEYIPALIKLTKRKRSPHLRLPSQGHTLFGESPKTLKKFRPPDEDHSAPLTAPRLLQDTIPSSDIDVLNSVHNSTVTSHAANSQGAPSSLTLISANYRGTPRILDLPTTRTREANWLHTTTDVTNEEDEEETDSGSAEPLLDEWEILTQASVASVVFGKAIYSRKWGLEEAEAYQRVSIKNVKIETHKPSGPSTPEIMRAPNIQRLVAVPYTSPYLRCDQIIEEILGPLDTGSSEIVQSEPSAGPASSDRESPAECVKFEEAANQPSIPLAQVIGSPDVGASFVDLFQLPDLDISPASATFEEPVINREQPSESVTEETSIDFDDLHLFKYSETPITSKTTYIPTVFDSTYYNPRYCDLWAIGEGSQEYIRSQMVIAGIRTDIQAWRKDKDFDKSQDEIKIKDLREESGVHAGLGANVSIQDTPEGTDGVDVRAAEDGNIESINFPEELAIHLDQWTLALRSFIKGKKRFQPQDMLDMKRTLLDIYFHSAHIEPSSELAQAVLAFSNLLTSDFLDDDELGLRGLAMKSVQTWGAGQS